MREIGIEWPGKAPLNFARSAKFRIGAALGKLSVDCAADMGDGEAGESPAST